MSARQRRLAYCTRNVRADYRPTITNSESRARNIPSVCASLSFAIHTAFALMWRRHLNVRNYTAQRCESERGSCAKNRFKCWIMHTLLALTVYQPRRSMDSIIFHTINYLPQFSLSLIGKTVVRAQHTSPDMASRTFGNMCAVHAIAIAILMCAHWMHHRTTTASTIFRYSLSAPIAGGISSRTHFMASAAAGSRLREFGVVYRRGGDFLCE